MRIELFGGPMDGDKLPEGWTVRQTLFVESRLQGAVGQTMAHVYLLDPESRFQYEGLQDREGLTPLIPLRVGQRL